MDIVTRHHSLTNIVQITFRIPDNNAGFLDSLQSCGYVFDQAIQKIIFLIRSVCQFSCSMCLLLIICYGRRLCEHNFLALGFLHWVHKTLIAYKILQFFSALVLLG